MIKFFLVFSLFNMSAFASQKSVFEMMQKNNQVMALEQSRQIKISNMLRVKNKIKELSLNSSSIMNLAQKKKLSLDLTRIEKEISEIDKSKIKLLKR